MVLERELDAAHALLDFLAVPLALVGGVLAALAFSSQITALGSFAGLFTVLAIAVRNSVLLVKRYQRLQQEEGADFGAALVLRGAQERVVPVALTALATALALVPFLFLGGIGLGIVRPLAVVVLGGLVTATVVSLLIVPFLYLRFAPRSLPDTSDEELTLTPVSG